MTTYTISSQDESGHRIPLRQVKATREEVLKATCNFSARAALCDVVVTRGSKHVATYRRGVATVWNGKECKP